MLKEYNMKLKNGMYIRVLDEGGWLLLDLDRNSRFVQITDVTGQEFIIHKDLIEYLKLQKEEK